MIPSALMNGIWIKEEKRIEIRVLELSEHGFSFRISNQNPIINEKKRGRFCLRFFCFSEYLYRECILEDFEITVKDKKFYDTEFEVTVSDKSYSELAGCLSKEYLSYIRLVLEEEPSFMEKFLTGYPAEEAENFWDSFENQKKELAREVIPVSAKIAQGIVLDTPWGYRTYLEQCETEFRKWYLSKAGVRNDILSEDVWEYVYLGNVYCKCLFPEIDQLFRLLEHTLELKKEPVLQMPCMEESETEKVIKLLIQIEEWVKQSPLKSMEIVVNDWGMLALVSKRQNLKPTLGTFLVKQKKDIRMIYKKGIQDVVEKQEFRTYGWMTDLFRNFVRDTYGVERFSVENTQMPFVAFRGKITLYAPWYQMNTSTRCTLAAVCENGNRGKQKQNQNCPYYCETKGFLYPKQLKMTGRFNSLYGFDTSMLEFNLKQGADRLVWNFIL